jgi:hypothetical protein
MPDFVNQLTEFVTSMGNSDYRQRLQAATPSYPHTAACKTATHSARTVTPTPTVRVYFCPASVPGTEKP